MSNATLNHRCFLLAAALGAALSGLPEAGAQNRRVSAAPLSPDMLKQRVLDSQGPAQESAGDILCSGDAANLLYPLDESFVLVDFFGDGCTGSGCAQGPDQHNDDDSAIVALPFTYDLYSDQYTTCFINNNGNLTFGTVFSGFSAVGFPSAGIPAMVAPFWGDVDTGNPANFVGDVWMKFVDSNGDELDDTLVVTWDNVGYFNEHGDLRNTFQVAISDGTNPLIGPNNNVAFSFDNMCWTTGDASNGAGGFGGIPATVGANRGNGVDFFQIGRFDHEGVDYDGPFGDNDGVSFLDGHITAFNTATATTNIPPIPTNFPPGNLVTVDGDLAEVLELDLQFLSPEQAQTTTVEVVDLDGAQAAGLSITTTRPATSPSSSWTGSPNPRMPASTCWRSPPPTTSTRPGSPRSISPSRFSAVKPPIATRTGSPTTRTSSMERQRTSTATASPTSARVKPTSAIPTRPRQRARRTSRRSATWTATATTTS